jgi:outer membrane lipoprotein SlyB
MRRVSGWIAITIAAAMAAGCATHASRPVQAGAPAYGSQRVEYGQVHSIDMVRAQDQTTGGGGLVGGVIGAVVGRQIGSGSGRTAGTLVGAVGGAIIGNEIEKNNRGARDFYRVAIRTDQGQMRSFDYQTLAELHIGDRVRIENNQVYRY